MTQRCRSPPALIEHIPYTILKEEIALRRKDTVVIKRRAKLWAIYDRKNGGLVLNREEVILQGKPQYETGQVAAPIAKGHVVFTMAYEDFMQNAKSEFIKEETNNAD